MAWSRRQTLLAGLVAVALLWSAAGPCVCLFSTSACHGAAKASEAHSCCQKTAGIQAVTAACCEGGSVLVMATPEVPEVGPPVQQAGLVRDARPAGVLEPVAPVRPLPPLPLERTTVLLI